MKFAGVLTLFLAAVTVAAIAFLPSRSCFGGGENHTFYIGTSSADCREVSCVANPELERLALADVCGESAEYADFDLEEFLKMVNGKILFKEELSDCVNYYCSADLPYSVCLYGKTVNLHICLRGKRAKVGSPIIFGGY